MPVILDGKKLIPGPLVTIAKEVRKSEDGTTRGISYVVTLRGTISAEKGSPNSSGVFWTASGYPSDETIAADSRLKSIFTKQGAIIKLTQVENKLLEIQPYDGSAPVKGVVRLRSVNFDEGIWYDQCKYSITFECDKLYFGGIEVDGNGTLSVNPPEESWSVEQADERGKTYRIQHTISSTAKALYDETGAFVKEGWKVARDIVLDSGSSFLGLATDVYLAPNANVLTGMAGYNYVRGQQIDEAGGKYTATESWLMYDASLTSDIPCLEEYNVNVRTTEDGRTRVSIDGTLTGLEVRDNQTYVLETDRWTNAAARYTALEASLFTICQDNSGTTLNPAPLSNSIGKNILNGVITFSREYDNRPVIFAGALSANVTLTDRLPADVFASIIVLGKANGPVLQSIGTVTAKNRALAIELVMPPKVYGGASPTPPDTNALVASYYLGGFKDRDEVSWSENSGRYTRQISWTFV